MMLTTYPIQAKIELGNPERQVNPVTLEEWLSYISAIHPEEIELGLERVRTVAHSLNLLPYLPTITVAGTNGKGSTVEILSSIYHTAGYKVGAYTSPHLYRFNERIVINRTLVEDAALVAAFNVVEKARGSVLLTYFEYTTLAALFLFKQAALDIVILEVGMGGRLDAVNIVDPMLAIIVSLGKDHTQWLGDTLEKIAFEKAGIARPNIPVILGKKAVACAQHIQSPFMLLEGTDFELNMPVYADAITQALKPVQFNFKGKEWEIVDSVEPVDSLLTKEVKILAELSFTITPCKLPVPSQACVLAGVACLQKQFPVSHEALQQGFEAAQLPARFEVIAAKEKPTLILDVAHNPDAAEWLKEKIMAYPTLGQIKAVWSSLADKDVHTILFKLKNLVDCWYVSKLNSDRSLDQTKLKAIVAKLDSGQYFDSIQSAFIKAYEEAHPSDTIVVFGSFHVLSEIMEDKNAQAIITAR